jgi:hypothetical protein
MGFPFGLFTSIAAHDPLGVIGLIDMGVDMIVHDRATFMRCGAALNLDYMALPAH